ncbi:MAG TPA: carboxypeptidase regulatory-like domain-containing protein [Anaerohalosphaeraceae bacterium]|nr:carboxypeptidase regulatory-like domain-containing protein [Anaerohalosphaeraceae bacterium]
MKRYGVPTRRLMICAMVLGWCGAVFGAVYTGKAFCQNGNPLGGVEVKLYQLSMDMSTRTVKMNLLGQGQTNPQGEYSITSDVPIDSDTQAICGVAKRSDYAFTWAMTMGQQAAPLEFHMSEPQTLAGRVVDEQGKPVAGAQVRLVALVIADEKAQPDTEPRMMINFEPMPYFTTTTDADGKFEFKELPAGSSAEFLIAKPGMGQILTASDDLNPMQGFHYKVGQKDISFTMSKGLTLSGIVMDSKNKPLADVALSVTRIGLDIDPTQKPIKTDADGQFSVKDLAAGTYRVMVNSDQWLCEQQTVELKSDMGVQLKAKQGTLARIKAVDPDTEKGREGIQIYLNQDNQPGVGGKTNSDGVFEKQLLPGHYRVQFQDGNRFKSQEFDVEEGKTAEVSVVLGASNRITGIVTGPDGKPAAGVEMKIMPNQGGSDSSAKTDDKGSYTLRWSPEDMSWTEGQFLLVAIDRANKLAAVVDIDADTKTMNVQVKPGLTLTGKVVDPNNQPIPNASVSTQIRGSRWSSTFDNKSIATDKDGVYKVESLPAEGTYYLSISGPKGYGTGSVYLNEPAEGKLTVELKETVLKIANSSVSGRVVDADEKPLEGARIHSYGEGQPNLNVTTDKDGKFTLSPICEGGVQLSVNYNRQSQYMYANAFVQTGDTNVEIMLTPEGNSGRRAAPKPKSLVGKALPAVLSDPNQFDGKAVLVCVWDYQQRPSRFVVRELAKKAELLAGKGVAVVVLQGEPTDKAAVEAWLKESAVGFKLEMIAADAEKTRLGLGVQGLPWMILTDKAHQVIAEGFDVEGVEAALEKVK